MQRPPTTDRPARTRSRALRAVMVSVLMLTATGCWSPAFSTQASSPYTLTSDVSYGRGEVNGGGTFVDLKLDLYRPDDAGPERRPLVVVVHGGGFVGGSKSQGHVLAWAREFASRGFIVASIDYRLEPQDPVPSPRMQPFVDLARTIGVDETRIVGPATAIDDTLTALDYLLARDDVEPGQTTLVGGSAGAITVDYLTYALDDVGIPRPHVAAVISNWGGLPFPGPDQLIQNPSPTPEDPYSEPPIFLAHATGDPTVPYALSTDIDRRAAAVGLPHRLYTKVADRHGFPLEQEVWSPGVSVLDAQVDFAICAIRPHLADRPECA